MGGSCICHLQNLQNLALFIIYLHPRGQWPSLHHLLPGLLQSPLSNWASVLVSLTLTHDSQSDPVHPKSGPVTSQALLRAHLIQRETQSPAMIYTALYTLAAITSYIWHLHLLLPCSALSALATKGWDRSMSHLDGRMECTRLWAWSPSHGSTSLCILPVSMVHLSSCLIAHV